MQVVAMQGVAMQGVAMQGVAMQGVAMQGVAMQGVATWSRMQVVASPPLTVGPLVEQLGQLVPVLLIPLPDVDGAASSAPGNDWLPLDKEYVSVAGEAGRRSLTCALTTALGAIWGEQHSVCFYRREGVVGSEGVQAETQKRGLLCKYV